MKKSKFTEAQIIFAIKQSEQGVKVEELCRKMGISEATFYNWKKKYGGLGVTELRELRMLKDENARLKKMVADLSLDKEMLQDVIKKSFETSPKEGVGITLVSSVQDIRTQILQVVDDSSFGLLLQSSQKGRCCPSRPSSGDSRNTGSVWSLEHLYAT
jgi:putative transposase